MRKLLLVSDTDSCFYLVEYDLSTQNVYVLDFDRADDLYYGLQDIMKKTYEHVYGEKYDCEYGFSNDELIDMCTDSDTPQFKKSVNEFLTKYIDYFELQYAETGEFIPNRGWWLVHNVKNFDDFLYDKFGWYDSCYGWHKPQILAELIFHRKWNDDCIVPKKINNLI